MSEKTTNDKVRERLERIPAVQRILGDLAEAAAEREAAKVDADPEAHRTTLLMQEGKPHSYRYWIGEPDAEGREVRWCYSCWRNRAGYFLTWREVWDAKKGEGRRDRWGSQKKRNAAATLCKRWASQRTGEAD